MKVSFVYRAYENIGIQMLSACLERAGHRTRLHFDPQLFNDGFLHSPRMASLLGNLEDVDRDLVDFEPDLVCLSVVTVDFAWARDTARRVRRLLPRAKVAFGGIHVTSNPEEVLADPVVDYAVVGEGDEAIVELAEKIERGESVGAVANVGVHGGRMNPPRPLIEDLDSLPLANKSLHYAVHPLFRIGYTILSGRGCPNNCSYCHNNVQARLYGRAGYLRRRSVESVVEELARARRDVNPFLALFVDDNFCHDAQWLERFSDLHPRRGAIAFFCFIHPSNATPRTIDLLKRAGCAEVQMGIQTLDPDVRRRVIGRPESEAQIAEAIDAFRRKGIRICIDFILNLPGHDEASLTRAARFFAMHPPNRANTFWLSYYPSLDITAFALEHGILSSEALAGATGDDSSGSLLRGGTSFDRTLARTQILFLLATTPARGVVRWLTESGLWRRIPFPGFTGFWLLNYLFSYFTLARKNNLYGKRLRTQYRVYGIRALKRHLGLMARRLEAQPAVPFRRASADRDRGGGG